VRVVFERATAPRRFVSTFHESGKALPTCAWPLPTPSRYILVFSSLPTWSWVCTLLWGRWSHLSAVCRCGSEATSSSRDCIKCGIPCCSTCSFTLGSVMYCVQCARSILDTHDPPLSSAAAVGPPASVTRATRSGPAVPGGKSQWIILVARDQPELLEHLVRSFAGDDKVEVIMDRRRGKRRNPPRVEERLRSHGAAVVKRPSR
jgi:hypothetical protein